MTSFLDIPIDTDSEALYSAATAQLQSDIPGWQPAEGNLEVILLRLMADMATEAADVAADAQRAIFRYWCESLTGQPAQLATSATADSTWTMVDDQGYTIPLGTLVGLRTAGDELVAFATDEEVTVAPGGTATAAGEVPLVAVEEGEEGSGLSGSVEMIDALSFVSSVALVGQTTGGVDAEPEDDYLDRLATKLQTLSDRAILPRDFATLATEIAGVERAIGIDGYDPVTATYDNERTVHVVCVDASGASCSGAVKSQVDALLQSKREVNFLVTVGDPTSTSVDVTFEVMALRDYDTDDVEAAVIQAITDYLDPATWGTAVPGPSWEDMTYVRYSAVERVILNTEGVDYSIDLMLNGAYASIALPGPGGLPAPGTITGTVYAP